MVLAGICWGRTGEAVQVGVNMATAVLSSEYVPVLWSCSSTASTGTVLEAASTFLFSTTLAIPALSSSRTAAVKSQYSKRTGRQGLALPGRASPPCKEMDMTDGNFTY